MGRGWSGRTREAERAANAAWDELVDALGQVAGTARSVRRRTWDMADGASGRVGAAAGEARWRAKATRDALAGKRSPMPWLWIAGAVAAGAVAGLMAGAAARRALVGEAQDPLALEEVSAVDLAGPVTLVEATVPPVRER
ncbi:MAG: hypothetical protein V7603_732 [Micromonosporaceae bacterium]